MKDAAVNRLATSITQLTLCQVTTSEVDAATKLLDKACQKLQGIQSVPSQRVTDLEAAIRQIRQLSYEVSQAQKALLLLPHHAQMMNIICQLMKTNSKSTSTGVNSKSWQPSKYTVFGTLPSKLVPSCSSTRNYPRVG